jgi:uncharacterized cupredoxin-like copper-binding protein
MWKIASPTTNSEGHPMTLRSTSAKIALIPLVALATLALSGTNPAGASAKTKVKAVETEFHIALSKKTFSPGTYTFVAENKGKITHALEITGPGLHHAATADIDPGKRADLTVTFKSGKYDIFCPIPGHKMLGMNVDIVVSVSSGHPGAGTSGTSGTSGTTGTTGTTAAGSGGTAF